MLSSGVESLLDSAVIEELYTGLPESISPELMAVSEPGVGLDAKSGVATAVLAPRDSLLAEQRRTSGAENFCQKTEDLGDVLMVISHGPAGSLSEALQKAGDLKEDEKFKKRNFRKLDCSSDGYQKEDREAQNAEKYHAECSALTPGESWSKQEDPQLNQHEVKASRSSCAETAGSLKITEENQANVQVTAETLPKLTEEVQGMKADGTRIFSKAGYRSDRVSKGLPPESNQCPDVGTVMARAGVSETSMLGFLEPLKVMDIMDTEHPQESNEYNWLKAHTAIPLRTGGNVISGLDTREENLPRQYPVYEFNTSLATCQTYQQDEENNAHDLCTGLVPKHHEAHKLSSVESCRTFSTKSSKVLCSVLKSISYLDTRNMPLESNSTAVHENINETQQKHLPKNIRSQTYYDHGTRCVKNQTSTSVPVKQILVVRNEGLSSAKIDCREVRAAEVWRKTAVGDNAEVRSWPKAQEDANSDHCCSSVFSSVASSPEEFSKEKFKVVPSEGDKLKKDQWQFCVSGLCKDNIKEHSLLMETNNIASYEIGQTDMCFYNASSKISPPSSYSRLDLSAKLEEDSPKAKLLEKEFERNRTSVVLAGSSVEAIEANSNASLSTGKASNLFCTLNVTLPPVAQKPREPHRHECPPCAANEVSSRDKVQDNLSGKESSVASGTTGEQVTEIVLHKDKFKSSVSSRTFGNPNTTSRDLQKNMRSLEGHIESVVTGFENEHSHTWNCNHQNTKDQYTAASTSCILSGSTCVNYVLPNSHSLDVEGDKIEENNDLEGEAPAGSNSKKAVTFPEARFLLARGSSPCENDWDNRGVDLHAINDISTANNTFCPAPTAEKSVAALLRDKISVKNMEVVKQFNLCKVTDNGEMVCDRDEAKGQIGMCALQTNEFAKISTVDSSKAPEGNRRNKTNEQLVVGYLNKNPCVHNYGFCNSTLGPKKRELGTYEKKEVSSLTGNPSECSASICDTCLLLSNVNAQTRRASATEKTLHPMGNQWFACQSEFDGPVLGSKQHVGSLNDQPNTGSQTTAASVDETEIPVGSGKSEEIVLKASDNLPLLFHTYARMCESFQGTLKKNVVDLDSSHGVRSEDCSGRKGFISDVIEEKTIKLKEHKNRCEREGTLEESLSDSKSYCSQHACFIKCAKEKAELVFPGNKTQQSLPKTKWLVEDQENTVNSQFLPFSAIHGSLSYKPENKNVLSETENKRSLRIKPILNNSCLQLTFEPSKQTVAQKGIGPLHFRKFDIQKSFNETQVDSETPSTLNLGISLPVKEELCAKSEKTQTGNRDSSSAEVFSKDSSVTKSVSIMMPAQRKGSPTEISSSESEMATGFLSVAKGSGICAQSKENLRDEGHSMLTVKATDVTSPKSTHCGEKFKSTCIEEKMGREVGPRKKFPIDSFLDEEDYLRGALLKDSKESDCNIVPLSTENYGKILEEIPRSNRNNLLKERKNETKVTNSAGTSLLSDTVHDGQAEDPSDTETSPESQRNTTPTLYPCMSIVSNSCKESSPNCVVCSEACVPYKLNAKGKDDIKEITECRDAVTAHSVCKEKETLGSEALDQIEKCHAFKRNKKYEKMEVHLSGKAQEEQKSEYQEEAKITLQPSMLHSSELSCSTSDDLVPSRNTKFEGPSEEISTVRTSENKLRSTLQEVKRPKIITDTISSQFLKTQDSEMENPKLNLGHDGAFGTTNKLREPLPLKRQPARTCKKVSTSYQLTTTRKSKKNKSSPFVEIPPEIVPKQEKPLLKSLYFPHKPLTMETETAVRFVHMPRQRAKRCGLLSSLKFRKCTKEPALLSKLSAMASNLLAPAKSIHKVEPLPYSSEILPVGERYSQRRSKNLLEAFSCINRNLHSRWADSWCTKMFSFQPLALYPVESTKMLFSNLSHKPPTSFLDTPVFPVSFHIKLVSSPVTDLTGIASPHSVRHRPVLGEMAAPPSQWTFSSLLSQSCSDRTAFKEDSSRNHEPHSSLHATTPSTVHPGRRRSAVAERRGCSMLGLHTVLALSSPGCYRIWTRRRNLTSHIPTIQRLFISQFAQGLKRTRHPTSVSDDLVSSLPYSLGRALSIWSQHGPSAWPSETTPLHPNYCRWQPSVGIENSHAMSPHLPVQSMEALQTAGREICLETSFPLPSPKSCSLPASSPSPPRLPASKLQLRALDEADASVPACLKSQDDTELKKTEPEKRPKKVSQIRIRKTVPKPDPNLTPMGLPKPKRLKKKEFSLEEIYTNKNYKSPPPARSLETIFEEPKEKNGRLVSVSQQKRKRILEFQDFTLPRKRKTRGKIKAVGSFTRGKKAALQSAELDALLSQKLMDLEAFFAEEAEQEQASSI